MNYDSLLLALRPLLLDYGITPEKLATLIEDAQSDLYHPKVRAVIISRSAIYLHVHFAPLFSRFNPRVVGISCMREKLANNK